jgi:hypothetical protein
LKNNNALLSRRLIFDWAPHRWNQPLIGFLGVSLLVHFAAFYLFQIVYPTTNSLLPPTAQVSVLNPKNQDDHRILDWVELHDPSTLNAPKFRNGKPTIVPIERSFSTRLEFGNNLQCRHPVLSGSPPAASEMLEPSTFFVGVSPEGKIEYLFLWQTSGSDHHDAEAEQFLRQIHFQSASSSSWDLIKVRWGMTKP